MLDLDATDIPLYGHQPERFFHGYYDNYCYLPLYIFAGDQLLCARLRPANQDGAAGSLEEVKRIVGQLRSALAGSKDRTPRRLRLLPRGADGLVRAEPYLIMSSAWPAISACAASSAGRCTRRMRCMQPPARRRASSPSSTTEPRRPGRVRAAWWPRPNASTKGRKPALHRHLAE